jgi:hypothetical protein
VYRRQVYTKHMKKIIIGLVILVVTLAAFDFLYFRYASYAQVNDESKSFYQLDTDTKQYYCKYGGFLTKIHCSLWGISSKLQP